MAVELRYWDSCCFIGHLAQEPNVASACEQVLVAARSGEVRIVLSTLVIAEVVKVRHHPPLASEDHERVEKFFQSSFLVVRQLDRVTAELARRLVWDLGIEPKDAVHVSTALRSGCSRLDTTDDKLLKRDRIEYDGFQPLAVQRPSWDGAVQESFELD